MTRCTSNDVLGYNNKMERVLVWFAVALGKGLFYLSLPCENEKLKMQCNHNSLKTKRSGLSQQHTLSGINLCLILVFCCCEKSQ